MSEPRFEAVASFTRLVASARRAARGKAISNETARFLLDIECECLALRDELLAGTYQPRAYRTFVIREPKPRTISAAAFRDRVVHHALCEELVPALERGASSHSYACRVGMGQRRALRQAQALVRRFPYVLTLDIEHFFETLSHALLMRLLRRRIADARLLALAENFVRAGAPGSAMGRGVPIGNLTSQHFANFYLGPLDRHIEMGIGLRMVRYMDDVLVFGDDAASLWGAWARIASFVCERLDVRLKEVRTRVLPVSDGVAFLGFRVFRETVRLDGARRRRLFRRLRGIGQAVGRDDVIDASAQASGASMMGWAAHADTRALRSGFLAGGEEEVVGGRGGSNRVNRGGGWNNNAQNARAGNRNNNTPDNRNNNLGFRLSSTAPMRACPAAGIVASTDSTSEHGLRPIALSPGSGAAAR